MNKRPPAPTLQIFQQNKKLKQALVCEPPVTQRPIQSQAPNYCTMQNQSFYPQQHPRKSYQQNSGTFDDQNYINDTQNSIPSHQPDTNNFYTQNIQQHEDVNQYKEQYNNTYNDSFYNNNDSLPNQTNSCYNNNDSLPNQNNSYGSRNVPKYAGNSNIYPVYQSTDSAHYPAHNQQRENHQNQNMTQGYLQNKPNVMQNMTQGYLQNKPNVMQNMTQGYLQNKPNVMQMTGPHRPSNMIAPQNNHQMNQSYNSHNEVLTNQQNPCYNMMQYTKDQQNAVNMNSSVPTNNLGYNSASSKYLATTATSLITNRPVVAKIEEKKEVKKIEKEVKKPVSRGSRTISATISSLLHWSKYSEQCPMLFELYACVESVDDNSGVCKKFRVSDSEGGLLNCVYYNMVAIPPILRAKHYRLLGKMNSNSTLQCVKITEVSYNSANPELIKQSNISMSKFVLHFNEQ